MKSRKPKPRNEILSIDVPDEIATELNSILEVHPFSRSRLGLLALQIALPELKRRYPTDAKVQPKEDQFAASVVAVSREV